MEATFVNGPYDGQTIEIGPTAFRLIDVYESATGAHEMFRKPKDSNGRSWQYVRTETVTQDTVEIRDGEGNLIDTILQDEVRTYSYIGTEYARPASVLKAKTWSAVGPVRIFNGADQDMPYEKVANGAFLANGWKVIWETTSTPGSKKRR